MESTITKKRQFQLTDKTKERLIFSICLICIFLFIHTAYSKVVQHETFLKGLSKVSIIGSFAGYIAWLVPAAEIGVSILLIMPKTQKLGLYAFTGLMTLFTGYILCMLLWAEKLPCLCGGAVNFLSWPQHLWFNIGFISLSLYALWLRKTIYLKSTENEKNLS